MKYKNYIYIVIATFIIFLSCKEQEIVTNSVTFDDLKISFSENKAVGSFKCNLKDKPQFKYNWYLSSDKKGSDLKLIKSSKEPFVELKKDYNGAYIVFRVLGLIKEADDKNDIIVKSTIPLLFSYKSKNIDDTIDDKDDSKPKEDDDNKSDDKKDDKPEPPTPPKPVEKDSENFVTLYNIVDGNLELLKNYKVSKKLKFLQVNKEKHQELWYQVQKVVPSSYLSKIKQFMVFAGEVKKTPLSGTLAYVTPITKNLANWQMGIAGDLAYKTAFNDKYNGLHPTIVHEFAHILSLDNTQLNPNKPNCEPYELYEGCPKEDAYIKKFYDVFWCDKIAPSKYPLETYERYRDQFTTVYAATNCAEDIAETFRYFVLENIPNNDDLIKNKKIQQLSTYSQLNDLRTIIRDNVRGSLVSPRNLKKEPHSHTKCGTSMMMKQKIFMKN